MKKRLLVMLLVLIGAGVLFLGIFALTGGIYIENHMSFSSAQTNSSETSEFRPIVAPTIGTRLERTLIPGLVTYWKWLDNCSVAVRLQDGFAGCIGYDNHKSIVIESMSVSYGPDETLVLVAPDDPLRKRKFRILPKTAERGVPTRYFKGVSPRDLTLRISGYGLTDDDEKTPFQIEQEWVFKRWMAIDTCWSKANLL